MSAIMGGWGWQESFRPTVEHFDQLLVHFDYGKNYCWLPFAQLLIIYSQSKNNIFFYHFRPLNLVKKGKSDIN